MAGTTWNSTRTSENSPALRLGSLEELLRRQDLTADDARIRPVLDALGLDAAERGEVEAEVKYGGYVARQAVEVERMRRLDGKAIPRGFDPSLVRGLSNEARDRLARRRPLTVGEASRLAGVTPADLQLLLAALAGARA